MKAISFFLVLVLILWLAQTSCNMCSKKIDCPGFNDTALTAWFPYTDNQQLTFKNNLNEQQTFTLKNTFTTQPGQRTSGGFSPPPHCSAEKRFESTEKDTSNYSKFILQLEVYEEAKFASLSINRSTISFSNLQDTGFAQVFVRGNTILEKFANLSLDTRSFSNVIAATGDTSTGKYAGIYKIYFSKNTGIIAYSEYPSLKTWVKQ